jgi:hypothetical protein
MDEELEKKNQVVGWTSIHTYNWNKTCSLDPAPDVSSAAGAAGSVGLADIVSLVFFQNTGYF